MKENETQVIITLDENKQIVGLETAKGSKFELSQDDIIDIMIDVSDQFKPIRDFKPMIPFIENIIDQKISSVIGNLFSGAAKSEEGEEPTDPNELIK